MTPAHIRYLHEVARQLDAAPAVGGERGRIVARAAETLGKSAKTVYALLRRHAGWCSGRKARADSGVTCVDRELALTVGGLVHVGRRQNGKKTTSIKAARELLQANGLGVPDESTGEIVMPRAATPTSCGVPPRPRPCAVCTPTTPGSWMPRSACCTA